MSQKIPGRTEIETRKTNHMHTKELMHSINNTSGKMISMTSWSQMFPSIWVQFTNPHPKPSNKIYPQSSQSSTNIKNINPSFDFKEKSPFQEGVMSETFQRLDKSFFQEPQELGNLTSKGNLIHKYLPKLKDIDKILEVIQRKVVNGTHLPVEIKEIWAGYLHSSYFKDLYLCLLQNKLPSYKVVIKRVETLAEKYILLDSLLFKVNPEKETAVLAMPETCKDKIIILYHSGLFKGHQGVIKTYWTISDKIFIPNVIHYVRSYIKGCHLCQLAHNDKLPSRHLQTRINPNYVPMSRLSMDLKVMPRSHKGHMHILCIINKVTNYLIMIPIFQARSEDIGEALIENVITKYCICEYIIMDQDSAFMSSLMTYLLNKFNIKIKTVAAYNHQSLQAEHGIKLLSHILTKHLTNLGHMWPKYLSLATFTYNTLNTSNLGNYSPYKLTFGRKPKELMDLESNPDIKVSRTFKEYYEVLNKRIKYLQNMLF